MNARVLIVEDEGDIASVLQDYLQHAGFRTRRFANGREALAAMQAEPPELVLLDIMLPGLDGLSVLTEYRRRSRNPVILLTARIEEVDRLLGLDSGADDYICKPFSPREVVARVRAVLRRGAGASPDPGYELVLDETRWECTLRGRALNLTRREFRLLQLMAQSPGRIYSRAQLLDLAYADTLDVTERAIDSHVKNLRRKLATAGADHEWIRSVYGVGFAFEPMPS